MNLSKEVNQNSIKIAGTTFNISYNLNSFESSDLYKIEFKDELSKRPEAKLVNLLINIREDHPLISQFCNTNKEALHVLTSIIITQSITEILLRSNGQRYVGLYKKCFNEIIETIDKTIRD